MGKSGLSPGSKTNIGSRLDRILSKKGNDLIAHLDDKYMKLAMSEFLKDLGFKEKESDGDFIMVSTKIGVYKFYKEKPIETRVHDIPSEWDLFKGKIENIISKNPLIKEEKVDLEKIDKSADTKEEESRIYFIDEDNKRYYTATFEYNGGKHKVDSYLNKLTIWEDLEGNEDFNGDIGPIIDKMNNHEIDLYHGDVKVKVYDSKKDGELKTKKEVEIEERLDELKDKGFIILSDNTVIISDEKKYIDHKKNNKDV